MAYHDDLLEQAVQLVHDDSANPKQASLRRAVSTAYYAVFHMLVAESTANWRNTDLRSALARAFDHGVMKAASYAIANANTFPFLGENLKTVASLRRIGKTFTQLQEQRHFADYNSTRNLEKTEALLQVASAQSIFTEWKQFTTNALLRRIWCP